jgi:hypothetical protein
MSDRKLLADPTLERVLRLAAQRRTRAEIARRIGWTAPRLKRYLDARQLTDKVDRLARARARHRSPTALEREGVAYMRAAGYRVGRSRLTGGFTCEGIETTFHSCGRRRVLPTMGPVYCLEIYAPKCVKAVRFAGGYWTIWAPTTRRHQTITVPIEELQRYAPPKPATVRRWAARLEGHEVRLAKVRVATGYEVDYRGRRRPIRWGR